jgi:arylamine N-acetyltransferase
MAALQEPYRRYLRVLGIDGVPSGLDGLRTIVRRHLFRAPFENISKLLLFGQEGAGRFITLSEFLDRMEHQDLGGTCHSCNPNLADLLRELGYDTDLLGADMGPRLNCHTCLRVRVDSVPYHVDVGYGGPFRAPIRLDRLPYELIEGTGRYVLGRTTDVYEMVVFSGQNRVHGYIVHDTPRTLEFFTPTLQNSFQPTAAFMNCVRICRFFEDHSVELLDRSLSIHRGTETIQSELNTLEEWKSAIANHLCMPRCPSEAALKVLEQVTGKPFFGERNSNE